MVMLKIKIFIFNTNKKNFSQEEFIIYSKLIYMLNFSIIGYIICQDRLLVNKQNIKAVIECLKILRKKK